MGPSYTSRLIFTGDFNANSLTPYTTVSRQLNALYTTLSLNQHVTKPTHFCSQGVPSIIDLVFTPSTLLSTATVYDPIGTSDHNSVLTTTTLPTSTKRSSPPPNRIWKYQKADFDSINEQLTSIDWSTLLPLDPEQAWSTIQIQFLSINKQHTPMKTKSTYCHLGSQNHSSTKFIDGEDYLDKPHLQTHL